MDEKKKFRFRNNLTPFYKLPQNIMAPWQALEFGSYMHSTYKIATIPRYIFCRIRPSVCNPYVLTTYLCKMYMYIYRMYVMYLHTVPVQMWGTWNGVKVFMKLSHLSNQYERYESQYTFVNPFETDLTNYLKFIFIMILRPHGSSFEIFDFEIEAFALK